MLILLSLIESLFFKKRNGKKDVVIAPGSEINEVILAILDEIITIYMGLILKDIWNLGLESLFS